MNDFSYKHVTDDKEIDQIFYKLAAEKALVIDVETTGIEHDADIIEFQLTSLHGGPVYSFGADCLRLLRNLQFMCLVGHNIKFDLHKLHKYAPNIHGLEWRDTMLMHHLLYEEKEHGLDAIVQERYNDPYKAVFWNTYKNYQDAPLDERTRYGCLDLYYTRRLYWELADEAKKREIPKALVTHVHRLARCLFETEKTGIAIDLDYLTEIGKKVKSSIEDLKPKMRALAELECETLEMRYWMRELDKRKTDRGRAGVEKPVFSFDSQKQLMDLLYRELGLPLQKNESTRNPTVDDAALAKLESEHPIIPLIREYRGHQKVYTAYIEGTLDRMRNGRIHPSFNVNGTVTGRISSSNPNMQQLPKEGGVRGIYVPDEGHVFLTADYGQLEVVLAAHFSHDENLIKIICEGLSQHDITAQALGVPRDVAKTINFAMQFGCTHYKLMKILKSNEKRAQEIHAKYWQAYNGLKKLTDACSRKVDLGEPIINPFGRQRLFEVKKRSPMDKAYRQAVNSLIQGTGADMTSWACYTVDERLRDEGLGRVLFSVHDELVVQVKEDAAFRGSKILSDTMLESATRIGITLPLKVDCSGPLKRWEK